LCLKSYVDKVTSTQYYYIFCVTLPLFFISAVDQGLPQ